MVDKWIALFVQTCMLVAFNVFCVSVFFSWISDDSYFWLLFGLVGLLCLFLGDFRFVQYVTAKVNEDGH